MSRNVVLLPDVTLILAVIVPGPILLVSVEATVYAVPNSKVISQNFITITNSSSLGNNCGGRGFTTKIAIMNFDDGYESSHKRKTTTR